MARKWALKASIPYTGSLLSRVKSPETAVERHRKTRRMPFFRGLLDWVIARKIRPVPLLNGMVA
jgi:hypothetical protein